MIRCCIVEIMRLIPLSPRLDFQTLLAFSIKQFKRRGESEFWTTCHTKKSRESKDNMSQTKCENSNKFCLRNLSNFFSAIVRKINYLQYKEDSGYTNSTHLLLRTIITQTTLRCYRSIWALEKPLSVICYKL